MNLPDETKAKLVEDMAFKIAEKMYGGPIVLEGESLQIYAQAALAALSVAYPVIRDAVLEEAAVLCADMGKSFRSLTCGSELHAMGDTCAQNFRAMKTEGGE